ncbi:hypothetical protein [Rhodococcus tibetensis]|uniref:Uncharacterized protein n=1 Tax=Rhodococcus tibetensis TaxID=2965064 RepID=A0ABT1Q8M8_9NOCA|nr:hypothetical protein [Rhodococcus sp. FXJ9.536]MCQ4118608.1 hypothetical protein [Rhodococcus sp. FXJ9.536]
MKAEPLTCGDYVTATFSRDFGAEGFDYDTVERIHSGEFDEWMSALAQSGLFTNRTIAHARQRWQDDPRSLLDTLLTNADEMTVKRYEIVWQALDRTVQFGTSGVAAEYA